jgi:N-methylhydantoinase B/oxoprolinase/acetone carboxylase alpha subunit
VDTCGGGGGAGGYRESSGTASGCYTASPLGACVAALPVSETAYPITVGSGGSGASSPGKAGVVQIQFFQQLHQQVVEVEQEVISR